MKLLYITRKYPPMVGGMEKVSFSLAKNLSSKVDTIILSWGGSQKFLIFVLPYFVIKSFYLIPKYKIDRLYLGDGLLSPLGLLLKSIFQIKTSVTIHGLDITYKSPVYQFLIPKCLAKLDRIICISSTTYQECIKRNIPQSKCKIIHWGIDPNEFKINSKRSELEKILNKNLSNKTIMITVGRLVKRKGVYWFIKNVMPKLNKSIIYLIIGTGQEKDRIINLINELELNSNVLFLGKIADKDLKIIYNTADIFIMPNIKVKNDIEGFGMVAVEAASTGIPIVASNIEGIRDAIINYPNKILLKPESQSPYVSAINKLTKSSTRTSKKELNRFLLANSWDTVGQKYLEILA